MNENENDGIVYCGYKYGVGDEHIAELIAKYVFNSDYMMTLGDLKTFARNNHIPWEELCSPIFIYPPVNNFRLQHQMGAFIMAPYLKNDDGAPFSYNDDLDKWKFFEDQNRVIIPHQRKGAILKSLSYLGINEGTLFGGVTPKLQQICTEEKWNNALTNNLLLE